MWFVYVLSCTDGSFYTGITINPQKRLITHKKGKGGKYTRSHKPESIVYLEKAETKGEALRREWEIKKWNKKKKIKLLINTQ